MKALLLLMLSLALPAAATQHFAGPVDECFNVEDGAIWRSGCGFIEVTVDANQLGDLERIEVVWGTHRWSHEFDLSLGEVIRTCDDDGCFEDVAPWGTVDDSSLWAFWKPYHGLEGGQLSWTAGNPFSYWWGEAISLKGSLAPASVPEPSTLLLLLPFLLLVFQQKIVQPLR